MRQCDLFVIGGGSGGVRAARLAAAAGARVVLAERGALGGTCVNVGCVPKKLLSYAAAFADEIAAAPSFGWADAAVGKVRWHHLRTQVHHEIRRLNGVYEALLKDAGVVIVPATASLVGERVVRAGEQDFAADKVLLATGSAPHKLPIEGASWAVVSDDMFSLAELPRRAVVVGGGYIALEFASILCGLGVEVELCFRAAAPLRGFDEDMRAHAAAEIARHGVVVRPHAEPHKIVKTADGELQLHFVGGGMVATDLILLATGRRPLTDGIGLERTAAHFDGRGFLSVNDDYQTACEWLYAIGDLLATPALTPVATAEAGVFVARVFGGERAARLDYDHIPTAVFSRPPLATVGMTEEAARAAGEEPRVYKNIFRPMKSGFAGSDAQTLMKLVVGQNGRVLGVHMVGADAPEMIQGFAVAIRLGATKDDFDTTVGVHPTSAEEFVSMRGG